MMTHTLRVALLALALAVTVGLTSAHAAGDRPATFRRDHGSITRVVFRHGCIDAEDSAAHPILVGYGNGTAIYRCARKGY